MENLGKAKKVVGRSFRLNFILYSCLTISSKKSPTSISRG